MRHSRSARHALTVLLATVIVVGAAGPAGAHDRVLSTSPADGAGLASSPAEITVLFNNEPLTVGAAVAVRGPSGAVELSRPTVEGAVLRAALPTLPDGRYTASYRVVGSDGHPVSGTFAFTVGDAPADAPAVAAAGEATSWPWGALLVAALAVATTAFVIRARGGKVAPPAP